MEAYRSPISYQEDYNNGEITKGNVETNIDEGHDYDEDDRWADEEDSDFEYYDNIDSTQEIGNDSVRLNNDW